MRPYSMCYTVFFKICQIDKNTQRVYNNITKHETEETESWHFRNGTQQKKKKALFAVEIRTLVTLVMR